MCISDVLEGLSAEVHVADGYAALVALIFASEDDAVYGASLVRLSDRCK